MSAAFTVETKSKGKNQKPKVKRARFPAFPFPLSTHLRFLIFDFLTFQFGLLLFFPLSQNSSAKGIMKGG